jgi:hypothetical protein
MYTILVAELRNIVSFFGLIAAFFSATRALYYFLSKFFNFSLSILSISTMEETPRRKVTFTSSSAKK